jgi:hypothetical protein
MGAENPQPSLADLLSAVANECGDGTAHRIHKAATRMMWKRLIGANQRAIEEQIARLRDVTGNEYRETQTRLDSLFNERNRLSDAAFGRLTPIEARP